MLLSPAVRTAPRAPRRPYSYRRLRSWRRSTTSSEWVSNADCAVRKLVSVCHQVSSALASTPRSKVAPVQAMTGVAKLFRRMGEGRVAVGADTTGAGFMDRGGRTIAQPSCGCNADVPYGTFAVRREMPMPADADLRGAPSTR